MMPVDLQIAFRADGEIHQPVTGDLIEHVIQKPDSRINLGAARAVEIDADVNRGLLRLAAHFRGP